MRRRTLPLLIPLLAASSGMAQSVTPELYTTSGGYGTSPNASVTWSVGEPVTETASGASAKLTQGFNQPRFNFTIGTIENEVDAGISVYPNPSADLIVVEAHDALAGCMAIFFDMDGKRVLVSRLADQRSTIDISSLVPANYILDLRDRDDRSRARFTINKTN